MRSVQAGATRGVVSGREHTSPALTTGRTYDGVAVHRGRRERRHRLRGQHVGRDAAAEDTVRRGGTRAGLIARRGVAHCVLCTPHATTSVPRECGAHRRRQAARGKREAASGRRGVSCTDLSCDLYCDRRPRRLAGAPTDGVANRCRHVCCWRAVWVALRFVSWKACCPHRRPHLVAAAAGRISYVCASLLIRAS